MTIHKQIAERLEPCPFCGEREELYPAHRGLGGGDPYAIDCVGCGIDFTPREGADVIAAWNRRALRQEPDVPSVEEVARLVEPLGWRHYDEEVRSCRFWGEELNPVPRPEKYRETAPSLRTAQAILDIFHPDRRSGTT